MKNKFKLVSDYKPKGDQPQAIEKIVSDIKNSNSKHRVLLGVTGSGKTFTMANVINELNRPSLILAHNKTLATQLYLEFKELFPENFVGYFVSYYDYYQPESYIPHTDTYIEKDSSINEEIDRMRHSATFNLLTRKDVIIVASVSCIYGIGSVDNYKEMIIHLKKGQEASQEALLRKLIEIQYERNDYDFARGTFRVRGDTIDIIPAYEEKYATRFSFFGDCLDVISRVDPLTGEIIEIIDEVTIYPGSHYVTPEAIVKRAIEDIRVELRHRITHLKKENLLVEAQRIENRTLYDIEMMEEMGYCTGIENYSRHLDGRKQGMPPATLMDYFPSDFLLFVDESHVSIPQVGAMYLGDKSRKSKLVDYGFRLPSAYDNRPLCFQEFESKINEAIYVSATPREYEIQKSNNIIIEQIIRPTGLVDPEVAVRSSQGQVDDLKDEILKRINKSERVLITTLTKRMAEDLTDYYKNEGLKVAYLHSEIQTIERSEIINKLRQGIYDVLIGINLLREGLDLPEVSLVAILDADKEGFLRSARSLIQTFGRASRNINGSVILYADRITDSMKNAMQETMRRRKMQVAYNKENNITPKTILKKISTIRDSIYDADDIDLTELDKKQEFIPKEDLEYILANLKEKMLKASGQQRFEDAAKIRDKILKIKNKELLNNC
ncbi:MAG: excinuclease ABC subunit UvrB [Pseudomonadota bacterium]